MNIKDLQKEISNYNQRAGWHEETILNIAKRRHLDPIDLSIEEANAVASKLALLHSEVSESLEEVRVGQIYSVVIDGKPEGAATEIVDVIIRSIDLLDQLGIDVEGAIRLKMDYNHRREFKHGGKII